VTPIRWKAILFGLSADFLATIAFGLLLSIAGGAILLLRGRPLADLDTFHFEPSFLAVVLACMVAATGVGGWVAARTAGTAPLAHGLVMGLASLVMGKLLTSGPYPHWFDFIATWSAIPAGVGGALLAAAGRARRDRPTAGKGSGRLSA
jgi:hypothetical protein